MFSIHKAILKLFESGLNFQQLGSTSMMAYSVGPPVMSRVVWRTSNERKFDRWVANSKGRGDTEKVDCQGKEDMSVFGKSVSGHVWDVSSQTCWASLGLKQSAMSGKETSVCFG